MFMIDRNAVIESGKKLIEFRDVTKNYQPVFYLEDGKALTVRTGWGEHITHTCRHIDSHHFYFGSECFHIDQFAELNHRNGNTCEPPEPVTDLTLFEKKYMDRSFLGADGKPIPYRALVGFEPDRFGHPSVVLGICPDAQPDRQVCVQKLTDNHGVVSVDKEFSSISDAMLKVIPNLPLSRYEEKLVYAVFKEQQRSMDRKPLDQQISGAEARKEAVNATKEQPAPER